MILTNHCIMPPREWMHNYNIKDEYNRTLKDYLEDNDLPVPYHL